jgi:hypothetical protein
MVRWIGVQKKITDTGTIKSIYDGDNVLIELRGKEEGLNGPIDIKNWPGLIAALGDMGVQPSEKGYNEEDVFVEITLKYFIKKK